MPRQAKTAAVTEAVAPAAPAVAEPVKAVKEAKTKAVAPAPEQKEPAKKKSKTAEAAAPAAAVEAAAPAAADAAPASEAAAAVSAEGAISTEFSDFFTQLQSLSTQLLQLKTSFRQLERHASRELKTATKLSNKRKRRTGNRSPSGFVKPTLISDDLATFLGKPKGSSLARTEVTREINAYIRANNLQHKENRRKINPDAKLKSLLKLKDTDELTYFNLQCYMSPHFAKSKPAATA
jgi:chromatin remodeling complex protein RSC6